MKNQIVTVTPEIAKTMLEANAGNRKLRRSLVISLKEAFKRGEYVQTHQGIAFADDGTLLDGQHRLTAISELNGGEFPMIVTTGVSKDAFMVMDTGAKRTNADALMEDRRLVAVANLAATICISSRANRRTSYQIAPYLKVLKPYYEILACHFSGNSKFICSAPAQLAAIVQIMRGGDIDYIKKMYKDLATSNLFELPPVGCALAKSQITGTLNVRNLADTISRCLIVYDKTKAQNTKIIIHDPLDCYEIVKKTFAGVNNGN